MLDLADALAALAERCAERQRAMADANRQPSVAGLAGWRGRVGDATLLATRLLRHVLPRCADLAARRRLAAAAAVGTDGVALLVHHRDPGVPAALRGEALLRIRFTRDTCLANQLFTVTETLRAIDKLGEGAAAEARRRCSPPLPSCPGCAARWAQLKRCTARVSAGEREQPRARVLCTACLP